MSLRPTLLLTAVAAIASLVVSDAPPRPLPADRTTQAAAEYLTKLRKLHLVRPDLINYPLVTDFVC